MSRLAMPKPAFRASSLISAACALFLGLALAACSADREYDYPTSSGEKGYGPNNPRPGSSDRESIFGEDGVTLFGGGEGSTGGSGAGIGVNSFLWRASLDTISFAPLASADPFGGVIITDWYSNPDAPDERFKMTVYILDRRLRADGLKVSVFKQNRDAERGWVDASVDPNTNTQLENAILIRARQLRINTLETES